MFPYKDEDWITTFTAKSMSYGFMIRECVLAYLYYRDLLYTIAVSFDLHADR